MDLDDDELRATRALHNCFDKNIKIKGLNDEKDNIINEMANDILHGRKEYLINVFTIEQTIDCYRRKAYGEPDWYIGK